MNQIKCLTCHNVSERAEHFYDLNVQVIGCEDLSVSLRQYCSAELLEKDSAYQCDICNAKKSALRSTILRELPPVLTFSCNRFRIDRTTNWQREKVVSKSSFPIVLDMSRFVEGSEGTAESVYSGEKERMFLKSLRGSMLWVEEVSHCAKVLAAKYVDKYGADTVYDSLNEAERREVSVALKSRKKSTPFVSPQSQPQSQIELPNDTIDSSKTKDSNDQSKDSDHLYQLFAVIMHKGSAHSGHYFAYIRDSLQEGVWELPDSYYSDVADIRESKRLRQKEERREAELIASQMKNSQDYCNPLSSGTGAGKGMGGGAESAHADSHAQSAASLSHIGTYDSLSMSPAPPHSYVSEAPPDLQYVRTSTGQLFIDESSVVGIISNIVMRAKKDQRERERKVLDKAKHKAEMRARANELKLREMLGTSIPLPPPPPVLHVAEVGVEITEDPCVEINHINDLISLRLGRGSWNSLYEKEHGQIDKFVILHDDVFVYDGDIGVLSLRGCESMNWVSWEIVLAAYHEEVRMKYNRTLVAVHNAAAGSGGVYNVGDCTKEMSHLSLSNSDSKGQVLSQVELITAAHLYNCDNDAALALALQESLNESQYTQPHRNTDSQTQTHPSNISYDKLGCELNFNGTSVHNGTQLGGGDEWLTATQKKKGGKGKSKGGIDRDGKNIGTENGCDNEGADQNKGEKERENRSQIDEEVGDNFLSSEKRLAEEMLSRHHGRYFDFNDSDVTAMPLGALEKAFEGKNSAYILVYKKIEKNCNVDESEKIEGKTQVGIKIDTKQEEEQMAVTHLSSSRQDPLIHIPRALDSPNTKDDIRAVKVGDPPAYWAEKVLVENREMEGIRVKYNTMTHTAKIRFFCPFHLKVQDPLLIVKGYRVGKEKEKASEEQTSNSSSEVIMDDMEGEGEGEGEDSIELVLDLRMSIAETKKRLLESYENLLAEVHMENSTSSSSNSNSSSNRNYCDTNSNKIHTGDGKKGVSLNSDKKGCSHSGNSSTKSSNNNNNTTDNTTQIELSILNTYGTGYHPDMPLPPNAILGDVLGKASTILVWNGRTIGTIINISQCFMRIRTSIRVLILH